MGLIGCEDAAAPSYPKIHQKVVLPTQDIALFFHSSTRRSMACQKIKYKKCRMGVAACSACARHVVNRALLHMMFVFRVKVCATAFLCPTVGEFYIRSYSLYTVTWLHHSVITLKGRLFFEITLF